MAGQRCDPDKEKHLMDESSGPPSLSPKGPPSDISPDLDLAEEFSSLFSSDSEEQTQRQTDPPVDKDPESGFATSLRSSNYGSAENTSPDEVDKQDPIFKHFPNQVKTDQQQKLLRMFLGYNQGGKPQNTILTLFKVHQREPQLYQNDTVLAYDKYVSKNRNNHSEKYLVSNLSNTLCCIDRQIYEILDISEPKSEVELCIFSKNTPCVECAPKIIKYVRSYEESAVHTTITKCTVQYIRYYDKNTKTIKDDEGFQIVNDYNKKNEVQIRYKALDRLEFFACFQQWQITREDCKGFYTPCNPDMKDDKHYKCKTSGETYNEIMGDPALQNCEKAVQQELTRLARIDSEETVRTKAQVELVCEETWNYAPYHRRSSME